jgi:hypothetical protein
MTIAHLLSALALLAVGSAPAAADLTKIDRTIAKEPAYKSKPRYCLLVFGPQAKFRVWLVIDGDTLYVDRNGNGDLTEPGEAVARRPGGSFDEAGSITEPDGTRHTGLQLQVVQAGAFLIALRVEGKRLQCVQMECVTRGQNPAGSQLFAAQAAAAPIIHFNGPLTMKVIPQETRVWDTHYSHRVVEVVAWLGTPGLGNGTFASIGTGEFLDDRPGPTVEIELPNKTPGGKSIRVKDRLAPDP